jgi:cytochrome c peroxidase
MNDLRRAALLAVAVAWTGPSLATDPAPIPKPAERGPPSAQQGAALFRDPSLGTNGKSCASCHEGGKRLDPEELAEASDDKLAAYANSCVEAMLKGKRLPEGSPPLRSLVLHLRSFQVRKP